MFEELKEMICQYVDVDSDSITEDARFMEDLGFTSFDFMTMLGDLEDEFDVEIDQKEVINVRTVGEALEYMKELGGK